MASGVEKESRQSLGGGSSLRLADYTTKSLVESAGKRDYAAPTQVPRARVCLSPKLCKKDISL